MRYGGAHAGSYYVGEEVRLVGDDRVFSFSRSAVARRLRNGEEVGDARVVNPFYNPVWVYTFSEGDVVNIIAKKERPFGIRWHGTSIEHAEVSSE